MTRDEWLNIGYSNGLIVDFDINECVTFGEVYKQWFKSKMNTIKPQSLDRIECTFNRYYRDSDISSMYVHKFDEDYINKFLNGLILNNSITKKEYARIYQIINNVLQYALDCNIGHCPCIRWTMVQRFVATCNLVKSDKKEYVISTEHRRKLVKAVVDYNVYPLKRIVSLGICLNFFLGLRIGELSALKWSDIDLNERLVHVTTTVTKAFARDDDGNRLCGSYFVQNATKTAHSIRYIPLINESVYLLNLIKQEQALKGIESEFVLSDGTDTIISKSIERCITRLCKLVDIPHFNSHLIRKTFASELHYANVPTKIISDLMGHSEIRTTEKCYILSYDESLKLVRQIMQSSLSIDLK